MVLLKVITVRVDDRLFEMIEEICRVEKAERADVIRRLLENAVEQWKINRALQLLREGKVTLRTAARIAGKIYVEMLDLASRYDVLVQMAPEDLLRDLGGE